MDQVASRASCPNANEGQRYRQPSLRLEVVITPHILRCALLSRPSLRAEERSFRRSLRLGSSRNPAPPWLAPESHGSFKHPRLISFDHSFSQTNNVTLPVHPDQITPWIPSVLFNSGQAKAVMIHRVGLAKNTCICLWITGISWTVCAWASSAPY